MTNAPHPETRYAQMLVSQQKWQDLQARLMHVEMALGLAAATAGLTRFQALAVTICNDLAARLGARRVSLGILRGRYVHVVAMNQTEKILRKMQLIRQIEEAMEECLDQDADIFYPSPASADLITRCSAKLISTSAGDEAIMALPLRRGSPVGVLILEFAGGSQSKLSDVARVRVALDLIAPRLMDLYAHDRWFGARWLANSRGYLAKLVGPTHTWVKAAAIAVAIFLAWAFFAEGTFYLIANFTLEPTRQAEIVAPFNGYIKAVRVRPGDKIIAHQTILADLYTAKLRDQLAAAQAQYFAFRKQADVARARGKIADMQIADDSMNGAAARMRLLHRQIAHAQIKSPISGVVLTGNLMRRIGSPVHLGDVLFKVAPIRPLVARIDVLDSDVLYAKVGEKGTLATASYPGDVIGIRITHINPMAQVRHHENVFRVRAALHGAPTWLRPGMQGTARIAAGHRRYIWIWTRGLVNWIRMKLWF